MGRPYDAAAHARARSSESMSSPLLGEANGIESQLLTGTNDLKRQIEDSGKMHKHEEALAKLRYTPRAIYDSQGRNGCLENTRNSVLNRLIAWSREPVSSSPAIFLLLGMAGVGKTAIAWSFCDRLDSEGRLGGSFFCSKIGVKEHGDVTRVIPNIAYLLAHRLPTFGSALADKLIEDPRAPERSIANQVRSLLQDPFKSLRITHESSSQGSSPIVVVIDALDECYDQDATRSMLEALIASSRAPGLPIKFFLTSRPERIIRESLLLDESAHGILRLHDIDKDEVDKDIHRYLQVTLARSQALRIESYSLRELVVLSGGLFVFAATVSRYILDRNSNDRLERLTSSAGPSALAKRPLYDMYSFILLGAAGSDRLEEHEQKFLARILSSILALRTSLSIRDLSILLGEEPQQIREILDRLHAVIDVPIHDDVKGLTTLHASFTDYLTAPDASPKPPICVDVTDGHTDLTHGAFKIMFSSLRFNMCNLPSSYLLDSEVEDLEKRVEENILKIPGLEYACRYWSRHLQEISTVSGDADPLFRSLLEFGQIKVLFWIEVMNLISAGRDCLDEIRAVIKWLYSSSKLKAASDVKMQWSMISEVAWSFFYTETSLSTPHLYISALATHFGSSPSTNGGWESYFPHLPLIRRSGRKLDDRTRIIWSVAISADDNCMVWGLEDQTMRILDASTGEEVGMCEGYPKSLFSKALCVKGTRTVLGSFQGSVYIWDLSTGKEVRELHGHTNTVWSAAFSADGTRIVSGSSDRSVRVWDASTGEEVRKLDGHTGTVCSVAFSTDGMRVVSGGSDGSVRIWDEPTGEQVQRLDGHIAWVRSVAFSPDGSRIASGSNDRSVRIWNATTGEEVHKLDGHKEFVMSVAFSPDGARIVSGSFDQSVRIWDAVTGEGVHMLACHSGFVMSVAFLDDVRVISASDDQSVRIWDALTEFEGEKSGWTRHGSSNWALSEPGGDRLLYLPGWRRTSFRTKYTGRVICRPDGYSYRCHEIFFDLSGARLGPNWAQCYHNDTR